MNYVVRIAKPFIMKYITLVIVSFLILSISAKGQTPQWVDFDQRKALYPDKEYFKGFSLKDLDKHEDVGEVMEQLKRSALSNLSNSIQVTVESVSSLNTMELDEKVHQEFRKNLTSFSKVDLAGIKTLEYHSKKRAYVLAYARKQDLVDYYHKIIAQKRETIAQKISLAEKYKQNGDADQALHTYYECMPLFTEAEEAQTIVILLEAANEEITKIKSYEVQVKEAIASLYKSDQLTLQDVCNFMAYSLKNQTGAFADRIRLANITFEDTKMGSAFSRRFLQEFEKELIHTGGYYVTTQAGIPGEEQSKYLLQGTYWQEKGKVKITMILRDVMAGKPVATAEGYLPEGWLTQNGVNWKPENFAQAHQNMLQFRQDEIVDGNLSLEIWTSKGNDSPIFEANDTLQFYVRVNQPAYVRIINHFADGSKVLLVDNLYLGMDKVNKVVKIPQQFQCAEPFGVEVLQVNGQSRQFAPLMTQLQYGYQFITDELESILKNTRGFKPIKNDDYKAEERIVVTTMAK